MERIQADIKEVVESELQMFYRMSGVMVQMLMFNAENQKVTLQAEVSHMENYKALEEMKDFDELKNSISGLDNVVFGRGLKTGSLPSLEGAMLKK